MKIGQWILYGMLTIPSCVVQATRQRVVGLNKYGARTSFQPGPYDPQLLTKVSGPAVQIIRAKRPDGYWHYAMILPRGKVVINAGCQRFTGIASAERHWKKRVRWCKGNFRMTGAPLRRRIAAAKKHDRELNKWSLAFVRKVKRLRDKK